MMNERLRQIESRMSTIDATVRKLEERQDAYMARNGSMDSSNYDQIQAFRISLMDEREKLYEEKLWLGGEICKDDVKSFKDTNPMKLVRCITERTVNKSQVVVGGYYYIDTTTEYTDPDGDKFAEIYEDDKKESYIGRLNTNHFEELMII